MDEMLRNEVRYIRRQHEAREAMTVRCEKCGTRLNYTINSPTAYSADRHLCIECMATNVADKIISKIRP